MRRLFPALVLAVSFAAPLKAQRPAGQIGAYTPPRQWPEEPRRFDLLHQAIHIRFDVPHRAINGEVTTRVAITQGPTDTIRLNAENLVIDQARDATGRALRFTADTTHVTVRLARRVQNGDTVTFTVAYHGQPNRGLYIVPRRNVIWSQGEATETRAWVPTYDAPNDKTTWEFYVTADSTMKVLSNGHLAGVADTAGGQKIWHWVQDEPASTYLYSVVAGPFTILHDQWRGKPVNYWTYADTVNAAWRGFGDTPDMMEIYSRVLGVNFPWDKYDQSIIPDFTYGGMENVSATTQTDQALVPVGAEPDAVRGLVAHELAHQWFGDYTTAATWAHIFLNEGLTTYMESVQDEHSRGWDDAELEWLGQQREAMGADENEERPLVWGVYQGTDPIQLFFSGHVYPKGAQLAHQLRRLLGDSTFWAGMHRFLVDNAHQPVTTADYAIAMERTCNCDLDWFFDQWAYGIGYPKVQFSRTWNAGTRTLDVSVQQTQTVDSLHPLFRFPVTLRIVTRDSVVRQQITVSQRQEVFHVVLPSAPLSFRFDEGGWLLGTVKGDLTPAELADMAMHDLDIRGREWALSQLDSVVDTSAARARRVIVLNEHVAQLRVQALRQLRNDTSLASRNVVRSALRDVDGNVRANALGALERLDSAAANSTAAVLLSTDPAPAVRMNALTTLARLRGRAALPELLRAAGPDHTLAQRQFAAIYLGKIDAPEAKNALERLTAAEEDRALRTTALGALAASGDSVRATTVALRLIGDYDPLLAVAAVRTVAQVGGEAGKARLRAALPTESRVIVKAAMQRAAGS